MTKKCNKHGEVDFTYNITYSKKDGFHFYVPVCDNCSSKNEDLSTGWYWTGLETVWVIGLTSNKKAVYYEVDTRIRRCRTAETGSWRRIETSGKVKRK